MILKRLFIQKLVVNAITEASDIPEQDIVTPEDVDAKPVVVIEYRIEGEKESYLGYWLGLENKKITIGNMQKKKTEVYEIASYDLLKLISLAQMANETADFLLQETMKELHDYRNFIIRADDKLEN